MDTMQMVVAIPLCFGSFVHHLRLALLCKIHTNTDDYWVDVITKCLWGKARMGSAYHFNLLMYFLALRIGTRRLPVISFWAYPLYTPKDESRGNCILVWDYCRNIPSDYYSDIFEIHVWRRVLMGIWKIWYIFLRLWDITVHTRPDGDLENLAIEKCTARDLKVTLLHSASHAVLDLVALTCLTSWMRGVPCSFYLGSTYALTFTSGCTARFSSETGVWPNKKWGLYIYVIMINYVYVCIHIYTISIIGLLGYNIYIHTNRFVLTSCLDILSTSQTNTQWILMEMEMFIIPTPSDPIHSHTFPTGEFSVCPMLNS